MSAPRPETYPGEARESAVLLLALGFTQARTIEALRDNFSADCNLELAVAEAAEELLEETETE